MQSFFSNLKNKAFTRKKRFFIIPAVLICAVLISLLGVPVQAASYNGKVSVSSGYLNVRSGPGTSYSAVGSVNNGTSVTIVGGRPDSSGTQWHQIAFNDGYGYVSADYISITSTRSATVSNSSGTTIYEGQGSTYDPVTSVKSGSSVTIIAEKTNSSGNLWYYIKYGGTYGYIYGKHLTEGSGEVPTIPNETPNGESDIITAATTTSSLSVREKPDSSSDRLTYTANGAMVIILEKTNSSWYYVMTDSGVFGYVSASYLTDVRNITVTHYVEFEAYMDEQGFPESYKDRLRLLHVLYPNWVFKAHITDMDWDYAVAGEYRLGYSMSDGSSPSSWKSTQPGAYDWTTGAWTSLDSGGWVASSEEIISYYMDARNFLGPNSVFQFLDQSFDSSVQTVSGVEAMVSGTFLSKSVKDADGKTIYYPQVIYDAGAKAGANPYVLASMILQEIGPGGTSGSISGTNSKFPGYYNFYNFGAYKTSQYSAVERGLWYASGGDGTAYGKPWDTRYKSITGGAQEYAAGYINRGQTTLYLKRFNVQGSNVFGHQYMSNTAGAATEGLSLAKAYSDSMRNSALTFYIPVYKNMPDSACSLPYKDGSPNNRLKAITVSGQELTPAFDTDITDYTVNVSDDVDQVTISAARYTSTASVKGAGTKQLNYGQNVFPIVVTAENGNRRTYTVTIIRASTGEAPKLTSIDNSNGKIRIEWTAVSDAYGYNIYRSTDGENFKLINEGTPYKSFTNVSVNTGVTYYYKVCAVYDDDFCGSFSNVLSAVAVKPAVLDSYNIESDGSLTLSWDAVSGADMYRIYRAKGSEDFIYLDMVDDNSYSDADVEPGETYTYRIKTMVRAGGKNNYSSYSNWLTAEIPGSIELTSIDNSDGKIRIEWSTVSGASGYNVYRSTDGKNFKLAKENTPYKGFTNVSVATGVTYYYKVCPVYADGNTGIFSNVLSAVAVKPAVLDSYTVESDGSLTLSWNAVSGASMYRIYRAEGDEDFIYLDMISNNSYADMDVKAGETYTYRIKTMVKAGGKNNYSSYSNWLTAEIPAGAELTSIDGSGGKIRIEWSEVSGASGYNIYRSTDGENFRLVKENTPYKSFTNVSVKAGTRYYYKVVAVFTDIENDTVSYSGASNILDAVPEN